MTTKYHIFANNFDDWADTLKEAMVIYKELKDAGHLAIRVYREEYDDPDGEPVNEEYARGLGDFPA